MNERDMRELRRLVNSDQHRRMGSCVGKSKFRTYGMAAELSKHRGQQPYHCQVCRQFHIGSGDRAKELARKNYRDKLREARRGEDEEVFA